MSRLAIVHVHDPRVRWSVRAQAVVRIVPAAEWPAPAVDLMSSLGPLPADGTVRRARVVVVRGAYGRETALIAAGEIHVIEVDPAEVLRLPAPLAETARQISAIIAGPDGSLSLLVEPSSVTAIADDSLVGEESCPSRS